MERTKNIKKIKQKNYTNDSITSLKGPDRVRKRPGVIFGSDDIERCIHAFFEILSNSVDEAKTVNCTPCQGHFYKLDPAI